MASATIPGPWPGHEEEPGLKLPPQNLEAEQGVLGSILIDNSALAIARALITEFDFYRDAHQIIFRAMCSLADSSKKIDAITLVDELTRREQLDKVGGLSSIAQIVFDTPHALNCSYYAEIVRQKSVSRETIELANQTLADAYSNSFTAEEIVQRTHRHLIRLSNRTSTWEEVEPDGRIAPPPFPLDVLPAGFISFVNLHAAALPCPPDFLAVPALSIVGAAMGRSMTVRLKRTWYEEANLWVSIVGNPGSAKSPALKAVSRPLIRMMKELRRQHREELQFYKAARREAEQEWKKAGNKGSLAPDENMPSEKRVLVMNTTCEALTPILAENPRGVVMLCDELSSWLNGMNQYRAGNDKDYFLQLWNRAPFVNDRKGTESRTSMFNANPFFGVCGATTPSLLKKIPAHQDGQRVDDGFFERLLYSFPAEVPTRWTGDVDPREVDDAWSAALKRLFDREMERDEADDDLRPKVLKLTDPAHREFTAWYDSHVAESEREDFPKELRGPWSKFRSMFARLLLALDQLHWAYDVQEETSDISVRRVRDTIRLIDYFKAHFRIVMTYLNGATADNEDARVILKWAATRPDFRFTEREARYNFRSRFRESPTNLSTALQWLVERNLVRSISPAPRPGPGKPPATVYEVHPSQRNPS